MMTYQQHYTEDRERTMFFGRRMPSLFVHLFHHKVPGHVTGRRSVFPVILAILALAVAATFGALYMHTKTTTATQLSTMQRDIAAIETQLTLAEDNGANQFSKINTKLKTISQETSYASQFTDRCPTFADGPDGPAQFWVACSARLPVLRSGP